MSKKKIVKNRHVSEKGKGLFQFLYVVTNISLLSITLFIGVSFLLNDRIVGYPNGHQADEYNQPVNLQPVLGASTEDTITLHGNRNVKEIALTFDADMTPGMQHMLTNGSVASFYDNKLIDILQKSHTKATLFMTGLWIESYPKEARALGKNKLFELANHSYSHGGFSGDCFGLAPISDSQDTEEVTKTQDLLKNTAGVANAYFRFPGGCYDTYDVSALSKLHVIPVGWDVVAHDGFNGNLQEIEANVLSSVQNGSIIVMHMNGYPNEPQTANAVAYLIPELKKRGFHFVKISELLNP